MSLERATEQGIKTALMAYTDTLDPSESVTYRCFFLDDESETSDTIEERRYPYIEITASPNAPTGHKSTFRDIPVEIKWATHAPHDKKNRILVAMYEACRTIIDTETTISIPGYTLIAVMIQPGGLPDIDDNEQYINLPLIVKICGA